MLGAALGLVGLVGALVQLGGVAIYPANYYVNMLQVQPLEGTAGDTLECFYLDWDTFPIAGHLRLTVARAHQLMAGEGVSIPEGAVPSEPSELWQYFIHREGLDFWWAPPRPFPCKAARGAEAAALSERSPFGAESGPN
jgi:hypothetical protein